MYDIVLAIHNIFRWIVLVVAVIAIFMAYWGMFGRRVWTPLDRRIGSLFGISLDIQLLLGLLLYFFLSDITRTAFRDIGAAMRVDDLRFFFLEHFFYMLVALVMAHLGSILARRAKTDAAKFQRAAIFFTLALLAIALGMPWARPLLPGLS